MKDWISEMEEDDGVDDAGTIRFDENKMDTEESVYPIVIIKFLLFFCFAGRKGR